MEEKQFHHAKDPEATRKEGRSIRRTNRLWWLLGFGFAVLVAGMLALTLTTDEEQTRDDAEGDVVSDSAPYGIDMIELSGRYADGTHELSGTLALPTPCHEVTSEVIVAESYPEQVTLALEVSESADMCAQVITEVPIDVSVSVAREARFRATVNGTPVALTISYRESE